MPRPMDLLDKYVLWPNAATLSGGTVAAAGAGHGARPSMVSTTASVALSLNVYSLPPGPPPAVPGGAILVPDATKWAFTFLKYLDGGVTEERLTSPILTGAMSGCYTLRYDKSGAEYVAHVGTGASAAITQAVKENWKRYVANGKLTNIKGIDSFYDAPVVAHVCAVELPGTLFNKVLTYHYYTGSAVYRMLLVLTMTIGPNLWKVIRVEELRPQSWTIIKMGSKFRGIRGG